MKFRFAILFLLFPVITWSAAKLTLEKTSFKPGQEIQVHFSSDQSLPNSAWIGVIPSNIPHGTEGVNDQHDVGYQYISGTEGTSTLQAPLQPGSWDLRLSSEGAELASVTIQVE